MSQVADHGRSQTAGEAAFTGRLELGWASLSEGGLSKLTSTTAAIGLAASERDESASDRPTHLYCYPAHTWEGSRTPREQQQGATFGSEKLLPNPKM